MFLSEWKYIYKEHRSLIRILLGIMLIPSFYAVIFLASLWNPYQETQHLPVDVVNEDVGLNRDQGNQQMNIGKTMTHQLLKSHALDFRESTYSSAQSKLNSGKIYMIIVFPKNFSKNISALSNPNAKQIPIKYFTSAGHSYVAMKMCSTAMNKIRDNINGFITKDYLNQYSKNNVKLMNTIQKSGFDPVILNQMFDVAKTNQFNQNLVSPIKLVHKDKTTVKTNGVGMAPYLISVALFVGCITLNIIYDTAKPHNNPKNGISWWFSKMSFLYTFILVAATIMFILLQTVNKLTMLNTIKTYGLVLLTAVTFLSIVTFFNLIFGMTGAWLMLLFMIVQLGGSAGTYPIQLSNSFFQTIHPYLPMSISIDAFRNSISIGNSVTPQVLTFSTVFVLFNIMMIIFFHIKAKRTVIW